MITNAILDVAYIVVGTFTNVLNLLPEASLPSGVSSAMNTVIQWNNELSVLLPMDSIILAVMVGFVAIATVIVFKFIRFGISLIPFVG